MDIWHGSFRDGRIALGDHLPHNHSDTNTNTNPNTNTNNIDANRGHHNNAPAAGATTAHANADADADTDAAANSVNRSLLALDVPNHRDFIVNTAAIPSHYSFSPLPSLALDNSLFATIDDSLSSPLHSTQHAPDFSLLDLGCSSLDTALRITYEDLPHTYSHPLSRLTTTTTAPPITTLSAARGAHQGHNPISVLPEHVHTRSGGDSIYEPVSNSQAPLHPTIRANIRNHYPSAGLSVATTTGVWNSQALLHPAIRVNIRNCYSSAVPSVATTAGTLSQSHMSSATPRPNPSASYAQSLPQPIGAPRSIDDHYLTTLATQDFSSPSLPPLSNLPSPTAVTPSGRFKLATPSREMPISSGWRRLPSRVGAVDLTKKEPEFDPPNSGVDSLIPLATMPPTTRRRGNASAPDPSGRKRRPSAATSPSRPSKARRKNPPNNDDSLPSPFEEDDLLDVDGHGAETIDLSNATEVPAELMAPKVDNRVKIGKFQCVICMDDTTSLTVTHCGHLFCSECLHSSLHIDSVKKACPVCRSKIDLKDKKKTAKSYYHLELKIMTATKKGKRPVGS
ncbi:hypothetical protein F4802DRAFT_355712 [Xylaria palmicola]|nr:hypothetical protein F4802DRAFT_355712 [Xylaria palmicola]